MRKCSALMLVVAVGSMGAATAFGYVPDRDQIQKRAIEPLRSMEPIPARAPEGHARLDTLNFGYVQTIGGNLYAVQGETWTFDHSVTDPEEGWYAVDLSVNNDIWFKRIDAAAWDGHTNAVAAPLLSGTASAWVGMYQDEADGLCWESGLGYGNAWCQTWSGPTLNYNGNGSVSLNFKYFADSEDNYDFTRVLLHYPGEEISLNDVGFDHKIGTPAAPENAAFTITSGVFGNQATTFSIQFEFKADGGWSDEDGKYATDYSCFGVDDIAFGGAGIDTPVSYDFESGAQGWVGSTCTAKGLYWGIADVGDYILLDPCNCGLLGNVMEFHDDTQKHPQEQLNAAYSPPAMNPNIGQNPQPYTSLMADFDFYELTPDANGVAWRPQWNYYPSTCGWSGPKGMAAWYIGAEIADCGRARNVGTAWGIPIAGASAAELVSFTIQAMNHCEGFGFPSSACTHNGGNETPLFDNINIRFAAASITPVTVPEATYDYSHAFQDVYNLTEFLSSTATANADISADVYGPTQTKPDILGDTLTITGPAPTPTSKWEAKFWFRIRREGPAQTTIAAYNTWKNGVRDNLTNIVGPAGSFAVGLMDSAHVGAQNYKNRFFTEFKEQDDDYTGEDLETNEILRDGMYVPGTQIEYFVTTNFTCQATNLFFMPDTTGGNYLDFEVLPNYRNVAGINKFPCILEVTPSTGMNRYVTEHALNMALAGAGPSDPIPNPAAWDRYDYSFVAGNGDAPFARRPGGTNGIPVTQLLGYRGVVWSLSSVTPGLTVYDIADFNLLTEWLQAVVCNGNSNRQGLIVNGLNVGEVMSITAPGFLANTLGAGYTCAKYYEALCGGENADQSYCVQVNAAGTATYPTTQQVDLFANWCPERLDYDVLSAVSGVGGVGNRVFYDYDGAPPQTTNYTEVVRQVTGGDNYRTVVGSDMYSLLTLRDANNGECPHDTASIVTAAASEIGGALSWIFGGPIPSFCENPCTGVDVDGGSVQAGVNRLYQNSPNPFNPRTKIVFSLAADGPAKLVIFDVNGRKVKTLVDGAQKAGVHELTWDGTNDLGHKVGSGVFWSQLTANEYTSNKKMVILK